jgi:hypothetical protein
MAQGHSELSDHFILGVTHKGGKFRPSDWVDRIATLFAAFDRRQRLCYHKLIHPSIHQGLRCLFVAGSLAMVDPAAYGFVMEFATSNHLQILEIAQTAEALQPSVDLPDVA